MHGTLSIELLKTRARTILHIGEACSKTKHVGCKLLSHHLLLGGCAAHLVLAPSAESNHRASGSGRQLELAPDAALRADGTAKDTINDRRFDLRVSAATELLELNGKEALIHLVDAAAAAEEVVDPERVIHDRRLLKEIGLPLSRAF